MFTDLIIGLITGLTLVSLEGSQQSIILFSLVFSILPDLDFLIYHSFYPIDRFSHKHRRILHLPLIYILIGTIILKVMNADMFLYISFIFLSLWHFIHDTLSLGFGVQWFFPFTNRQYLWGSDIKTSKKIFKKLYSDTPENIDTHADTHGDDNWAKKSFFK